MGLQRSDATKQLSLPRPQHSLCSFLALFFSIALITKMDCSPPGSSVHGTGRFFTTEPPETLIYYIFFLFSFSFIFISWRLNTLQYCSGFCHTLTWINHGFTCIPYPDPPLPPPFPPNSSGSSQCTRPEHLSHASSPGWWSVSAYIIYMFRCCLSVVCLPSSRLSASWVLEIYLYPVPVT